MVGIVAGLIFFLGGSAVVTQTILRNANPGDGIPPNTPLWLRSFYQLLCFGVVGSLGVVATWVAFGPGKRTFTGGGAFLGEAAGRAAFGIGAVLIWIVLAFVIFSALRRQR